MPAVRLPSPRKCGKMNKGGDFTSNYPNNTPAAWSATMRKSAKKKKKRRKKTVKPPKSKNVLSPQEKLKAMLEARDSLNERENDITIQILLGPPQQ